MAEAVTVPAFVQITAGPDGVYGLDKSGRVWVFSLATWLWSRLPIEVKAP